VYRRHTLLHPAHALVLVVPALLGLVTLDPVIALAGLLIAETLVVTLAPHLPWTRRAVDARLERRARDRASAARSAVLLRMSEEHRRELFELERIAESIRERCGTGGHDCLGVERLIELYVRFAIAHRASATLLEAAWHSRPSEAIVHLERCVELDGEAVREPIERRLEILRMRCRARRAAYERQAAIRHELATIGETLRWMQEQCAAASHDALHADLRAALSDRARDAETLQELSSLRDDRFDPEILPLGRATDAPSHATLRLRVAPPRPETEEAACGIVEPMPMMLARRM